MGTGNFPRPPAPLSVPWHKARTPLVICLGSSDGKQQLAISAGSSVPRTTGLKTRRETRADYDGRQELAMSWECRHHHPVPKLQEGRQEEIMMGDNSCRTCRTWRWQSWGIPKRMQCHPGASSAPCCSRETKQTTSAIGRSRMISDGTHHLLLHFLACARAASRKVPPQSLPFLP